MSPRSFELTILIPTRNRVELVARLLDSIAELSGLDRIRPEVIVADNNSTDETFEHVSRLIPEFPTTLRIIKVPRAGKSAAINDAAKHASGNAIAFLDDDVTVENRWMESIEQFFGSESFRVGQGVIRLPLSERDDEEIRVLIERYRTIPRLEYKKPVKTIRSLNGANFFLRREVFEEIGGFDERLGPGASGTSEDVEFARRLVRSNISIGYAPGAIVYHRIDRNRLTEEYFKQSHHRQGVSRFLIRNHSAPVIAFDLARAAAQYTYNSLIGNERDRYRSKGRIYHYMGMFEARRNGCRPATSRD